MKLDILAFAAHPDDIELSCSGTVAKHVKDGKKVGIVDFTQGELGTRGTPELRIEEAKRSAEILGLSARENLGFKDGFFQNDMEHRLKVVEIIRKYKPEIILANAEFDRHPDHGRAADIVRTAWFLSGLKKIKTTYDGEDQEPWRPRVVFHYFQSISAKPDFVVDVSDSWDKRIESIMAFKSQFYDPESTEPETYISRPGFLNALEGRAMELGYTIGVDYAEGFTVMRHIGVKSLFDIL